MKWGGGKDGGVEVGGERVRGGEVGEAEGVEGIANLLPLTLLLPPPMLPLPTPLPPQSSHAPSPPTPTSTRNLSKKK